MEENTLEVFKKIRNILATKYLDLGFGTQDPGPRTRGPGPRPGGSDPRSQTRGPKTRGPSDPDPDPGIRTIEELGTEGSGPGVPGRNVTREPGTGTRDLRTWTWRSGTWAPDPGTWTQAWGTMTRGPGPGDPDLGTQTT